MFVTYDLFIKLGAIHDRYGNPLDGEDTMRIYMEQQKKSKDLWWSVGSLPRGMSPKKVHYFKEGIEQGQKIYIYFLIHNKNYDNEFAFRATLKDIISSSEKLPIPDPKAHPNCFESGDAACWLCFTDLQEAMDRRASDYMIQSTGRDLKWAVENSQYKFGYIELK